MESRKMMFNCYLFQFLLSTSETEKWTGVDSILPKSLVLQPIQPLLFVHFYELALLIYFVIMYCELTLFDII